MMPMMLSFLLLAAGASAAPSGVAKPTPRQLEWVEMEIAALIHFNMASTRNCSADPAAFSPNQLDTDQWVRSFKAFGAREAVLVAKVSTHARARRLVCLSRFLDPPA
jgi:alpha-L-fucosidase